MTSLDTEAVLLCGTAADVHAVYLWVEENTQGSFEPLSRIEHGYPWPESGVSIDPRDGRMIIVNSGRPHWVNLGDYVVRDSQGEFYPCRPGIFETAYEPIGGES